MQQQKTSQLYDKYAAVDFYQDRYSHGYMDEWPIEKKQRIFEVIRSLELPDVGEAIDFGCGNGVLTNVIKQALPRGWKVYGTDISTIAVENAKKRYPECIFLAAGDSEFASKKFDFLFTHHVLEHVYDLSHVLDEIDDLLKDEATILHILPCGNEGSFEHSICLLRKDGVNENLENRFFFEDEGHVRRLNTEQLNKLYRKKEFVLVKEYYSNQYYGAINWITRSGPGFVRFLTDTSSALDENARRELTILRYKLFFVYAMRYPTAFVERKLHEQGKTFRDCIFLTLGFPFYLFSKPMDSFLKGKARDEWQKRKTERNGSEMYLFFKRHGTP
ncbi:class I SAM-dependent methyltransferase [Candidatus Roizmanbacteria bacterium]|nr:class I SAM-dependent methyltransferase [Candidatus Roizmanbacteria bacterium]